MKFDKKRGIKFKWKKVWGIPYAFDSLDLSGAIKFGSPFENMTSITEIAAEFGKHRAMIDLITHFKARFIAMGGVINKTDDDFSSIMIQSEIFRNVNKSLAENDLNLFFNYFKRLFASLSYNMKLNEGYFQSHIYLTLLILGFKVQVEDDTNIGRIDAVIETERRIYIMEFKNKDSSLAIGQIRAKKYYQKYFSTEKKIILVGVAVDSIERNIVNWEQIELNKFNI